MKTNTPDQSQPRSRIWQFIAVAVLVIAGFTMFGTKKHQAKTDPEQSVVAESRPEGPAPKVVLTNHIVMAAHESASAEQNHDQTGPMTFSFDTAIRRATMTGKTNSHLMSEPPPPVTAQQIADYNTAHARATGPQ